MNSFDFNVPWKASIESVLTEIVLDFRFEKTVALDGVSDVGETWKEKGALGRSPNILCLMDLNVVPGRLDWLNDKVDKGVDPPDNWKCYEKKSKYVNNCKLIIAYQ